jgi:fatty-acyl-CoA synthase
MTTPTNGVVAFCRGLGVGGRPRHTLLERIARFKRPKRYEFVEEIPKNGYGKVLKRELRARLAP